MRGLQRVRALWNSRFGYVLKIALGLSILGIFLATLDRPRIEEALTHVGGIHLVVLLALTVVRNVVGSIRFKVLSSVVGDVPLFEIMRQYFVASLFNNFLPTAIGGDGSRFVMLSALGVPKSDAGMAIVVERFVGFYALTIVALVSSLAWTPPTNVRLVVVALFVAYSLLVLLVTRGGPAMKLGRGNRAVQAVRSALSKYRGQGRVVAQTMALSVAYQLISVYVSVYVARVIGLDVPLVAFLTLVPLVWFFTMIPISLGGLGLREISFAYLFSLVAVEREDALIISLGTYLTLVMSGFLGGLFLLLKRREQA